VCNAAFTKPTIAPAGTTADSLAKQGVIPDLWLTLDPWPTVVAGRRARTGAPALDVETAAVASTGVGIVGPGDRIAVLKAHCGATKVWACVGDVSGRPWATIGGQPSWQMVHPAYVEPDLSASGYAVFANAVVAKLGATSFSNVDLDGIKSWGRSLESGVPTIGPTDQTPLEQLLLGVPRYDVIGVLGSEIPQPLKPGLDVLYPDPVANVAVVAVTRKGFSVPAALANRLRDGGWTVPAVASSGLPDPALADAVLAFWKDVKGP
jgi:hypothetical protein